MKRDLERMREEFKEELKAHDRQLRELSQRQWDLLERRVEEKAHY